jgi:hypothetical protein
MRLSRGDLVAGLTVWAVLVPESLAQSGDAEAVAGVVMLSVGAGLFFANADHVPDHPGPRARARRQGHRARPPDGATSTATGSGSCWRATSGRCATCFAAKG